MFDVIKKVVSADRIANGAWLHLRAPAPLGGEEDGTAIGDPLYRDPAKTEPVRALVRSHRSKHVRDNDVNIQTKGATAARRAKGTEQEKVIAQQVALQRGRQFAAFLVGLENATMGHNGLQTIDEQQAMVMADQDEFQWLVDAVINFAFDDANYGGDEAAPPKPAAGEEASPA